MGNKSRSIHINLADTYDPYKWLRKICRLVDREDLRILDSTNHRSIYLAGREIAGFIRKDNLAEIIEELKSVAIESIKSNLFPSYWDSGMIGGTCEISIWFEGGDSIEVEVNYDRKGEERRSWVVIQAYVDEDDEYHDEVYKAFMDIGTIRGLKQEEIEQIEK